MRAKQFLQFLDRWLLQHLFENRGSAAVGDEYPVVLGYRGVEPQAIAHHVGIWHRRQLFGGADIHIAAHNHRVDIIRGERHQSLV